MPVTSLKKDFFYDSLASLHAEIRQTFPDAAFFLKVMEDYRDIFAGLKKSAAWWISVTSSISRLRF